MTTNSTQQKPTSTRQLNAVALYLLALASVTAAYFLYLRFAVPIIEGPPQTNADLAANTGPGFAVPHLNKQLLIPLLPRDAWELSEGKVIVTEQATILFQKLEQLDNGSLQVEPFTLVSGLGEAEMTGQLPVSAKKPMVLRCLAGANLKFDRPLEDLFQQGAKLNLARLTGDVDIYRPPSKPDRSDMLHVLTRNVQVDRNRIYTLERVAFSLGNHRGRGRNLIIDLKHETNSPDGNQFGNIAGVSRLELAFLEHLRIQPSKAKNELQIASSENLPSSKNSRSNVFDDKSPIEIKCSGPFVLDLDDSLVSFRDNVVATQLDEHRNRINCDRLEVELLKEDAPPASTQSAPIAISEAPKPSTTGSLEIRKLHAKGSPAIVTANSYPARFTADELVYDIESARVTGRCLEDRNVVLLTSNEQVVGKQLSYTFGEGQDAGNFAATGPGKLLKLADTKSKEWFVTWENEVSFEAVADAPNQRKIVLTGKTSLRLGESQQIQSEMLELFVEQSPRDGKTQKVKFHPVRALATGNVQFQSKQMSGSTQRLGVKWAEIPFTSQVIPHRTGKVPMPETPLQNRPAPQGRADQRSGTPSRNDANLVEQRPESRIATAPVGSQAIPLPQLKQPPNPAPAEITTIQFHGNQVDLTLLPSDATTDPSPSKVEFTELVVSGDVEVTQFKTKSGEAPVVAMALSGDYLRLIPAMESVNRQVRGARENSKEHGPFKAVLWSKTSLAKASSSDVELQGARISVDQVGNRLWVTGKGAIKFKPKPNLQVAAPRTPFPTARTQPKPPKDHLKGFEIKWLGGMIFDGQSIYFEQGVRIASTEDNGTKRTETTGRAEAIKVKLDRQIDLQAPDIQSNQKAPVKPLEWILVNEVSDDEIAFQRVASPSDRRASSTLSLQTATYDSLTGLQLAQQIVHTKRATVDRIQQTIVAEGPGSVAMHQRKKQSSRQANGDRDPISRLAVSKKSRPITFVQINFDGELKVTERDNRVVVDERIRAAYVDVDQWAQGIDPDQAQKQSAQGVVLLTCESLQVARWQPRMSNKPSHELLATGNVRVDSEQLETHADRLSYDETTDSLVIEGTPLVDAKIWYRRKNDAAVQQANVQKGTYRLSDQYFEAMLKSAVIEK